MEQKPSPCIFGFSAGADVPQALPKVDIIWHWEFQLRKVDFVFFTSQQLPTVAACYEGSGRYNSTLKS